MNRREFLKKSLLFTAMTAVVGCGSTPRPNIYHPRAAPKPIARKAYTPRPIPEQLLRNEQRLTLYRREAWTTQPPIAHRLKPMSTIDRITIHHEGNPSPFVSTDPMAVADELRRVLKSHQRRMNAGDIGYHYIIDPAGNIWEGRSTEYVGAHVRSNNSGNLGIMLLGNFNIQQPTPEQINTLNIFLSQQMDKYHVAANRVYGHRDLAATECPGENLYAELKTLDCLTQTVETPQTPVKTPKTPVRTPLSKPQTTSEPLPRPAVSKADLPTRSLF